MAMHLDIYKVTYVREYQFAKDIGRKWRSDFAVIEKLLLIEVEGGVHSGGRHVRGVGYTKDIEKYNQATMMGWRLLRFTPDMILSGRAIDTVMEAISQSTT